MGEILEGCKKHRLSPSDYRLTPSDFRLTPWNFRIFFGNLESSCFRTTKVRPGSLSNTMALGWVAEVHGAPLTQHQAVMLNHDTDDTVMSGMQ